MFNVLIFGGTTEGRELAELCAKNDIPAWVCVATDYGASLLEGVETHAGRMTEDEMLGFIVENRFELVLDATHPYARQATKNIRRACERAGVRELRILRERAYSGKGIYFENMNDIIDFLARREGGILVATGSKELDAFCALENYGRRCAVRVLPAGIERCLELGFEPGKIIAAKGPFTKEQNIEHMKIAKARFLVTKESGKAGGFDEKLAAAEELGVITLVLKRPEEEGISLAEAKSILLGAKSHE